MPCRKRHNLCSSMYLDGNGDKTDVELFSDLLPFDLKNRNKRELK